MSKTIKRLTALMSVLVIFLSSFGTSALTDDNGNTFDYNSYPVVLVPGYASASLCYDEGGETKTAWGWEISDLTPGVADNIVELIRGITRVSKGESESLAKELDHRMQALGHPMDCLVQVNIADEESKFGLAREEVLPFLELVSRMPGIHVKGLMNIAPFFEDTEQVRPIFREMYQLFQEIKAKQIPGIDMEILSMGMSHDYTVAVEEGANMIRVGRSMFA